MSKTRPANLIPADAGAGAGISTAVKSPGCITSAKDTTTGCGTFWPSVATTGCCRTSTMPPTGAVTLTDEAALPTLPLASLNWKLTFVVPTGNNVSAVTSVRVPSIVARDGPRSGAASRMSTAEPPARNALRACDALDAATLARAPAACVAATVIGGGGVTTGGVVSVTSTTNEALPVLPCVSVAAQFTVVAFSGNVDPLGGMQVTGTAPSMLSVAVALKTNGAPPMPVASTVAFAGVLTTGLVASRTVTVNVAAPLLPCASVAAHVTVVVPNANADPLAGSHVAGTTPSTASVAVVVKLNAAPFAVVASTIAFGGVVITGAVVSCTVRVNEADPILPAVSVAVHLTVVVASGNIEPLAGAHVTGTSVSTLSVADAV